MTHWRILAWTGLALVAANVVAYWVYTLVPSRTGHRRLRAWLDRPRAVTLLAGVALCGVAVVGVTEATMNTASIRVPAVLGFVLFTYAAARQWAAPPPCRAALPLTATTETVPRSPEAPVVVLPGGSAVPLADLACARTIATADGVLVVHCRLAGSLAAFRDAPRAAAVLPRREGFELGAGRRRWDGLDGRALDGGTDLVPVPVALTTLAAWRTRFPFGLLLGTPPIPGTAPGPHRRDRPLAARDPAARMHLGLVADGRWTPLAEDALARCPEWAGGAHGTQRYLARWAAAARGLA